MPSIVAFRTVVVSFDNRPIAVISNVPHRVGEDTASRVLAKWVETSPPGEGREKYTAELVMCSIKYATLMYGL